MTADVKHYAALQDTGVNQLTRLYESQTDLVEV